MANNTMTHVTHLFEVGLLAKVLHEAAEHLHGTPWVRSLMRSIVPRFKYRQHGALRFMTIGRLHVQWCLSRKPRYVNELRSY